MEELYKKIEEINIDSKLISHVYYKPYLAIYISLIFGVLSLMTLKPMGIILGVFLIGLGLLIYFRIKDYKVISVYEDCILIYKVEDETVGRLIDKDDVIEWNCEASKNNSYSIMFKLVDGEIIFKDTFQLNKANKALKTIMSDKETRKIRENKNGKSSFFDIFKR